MATGYISRIVAMRGFGFIVEDGQSGEIEFHWTALLAGALEELQAGQRVQFDTVPDHRDEGRVRAVNVRLVGEQA